MSIIRHDVRRGAYYDSVVLMQLQRALTGLPGILDAGVVMATPANRELLAASSLLPEYVVANPDDLLIVVRADDESSAREAIEQVDLLLARKRSALSQDFHPRSLSGAVRQLPEAKWVLISVPGRHAAAVAREALDLDRHVFLYSDNVSLEDEISLKQYARGKGLLVMGPDCGTAMIHGVGLGFANRVRRGPIGLVGASGTGTQAVASHIHNLGGGISHAIGTGGRDLRTEVGAITAHQALDLLVRDPGTRVIVLLSKPPSADVATRLLSAAQAAGKPVVVDFIGYPPPSRKLGNLHFAVSLSEAAELAVSLTGSSASPATPRPPLAGRYLRGLFSGGTLAYEAMLGLQATLSPLKSNAPITEGQQLRDPLHSEAHTIIDLGDEFFMVGRLHPMIDHDLRIRRMKQEAEDPAVGLLFFDLVLGEGSHPDPASDLVPALREIAAKRPDMELVAVVVGTEDDPQNFQSQVEGLEKAGVLVFRTTTGAVEHISLRFSAAPRAEGVPVDLGALDSPLAAINVGLEAFYESLASQGASAVHVDWSPPAGGNERLASLLQKMKR